MRCQSRLMLPFAVAVLGAAELGAQTIDDGLMMGSRRLCTGFVYTHDAWDRYWEGPLERANGNIGRVTTRSVSWAGTYGLSPRLNLIAMLPWVATKASAGTLRGMSGLQDATVALKWQALDTALTSRGSLRAFLVGSLATPASRYTPDFLPLSIGLGSRRAASRLTLDFQTRPGLFVEATGAYTWRGPVSLDRPAYYDGERLVRSDRVEMPDVVDYSFRAGYWKHGVYLPVSFTRQVTLGGHDIRRQDMPFVSNRMNQSRVEALARVYLSRPRNVVLQAGAGWVVSGRNVGCATSFSAALLYTFEF